MQLFLDLVQQVERVLTGAVEFVDKHDDRGFAHPAHLHQLASLRLHAFRRVNDDDHAVAGRQHAERVLGEVLVARGVKNVDLHVLVLETHDGGGHGDPSLALDLHEVGGGRFLDLVRLHGSCHVYGATEKQ